MIIHPRFAVTAFLYLDKLAKCHIGALESGGPALGLHGVPWAGHSKGGHHLEEKFEEL